jgi:AI-2 transport protein TqsA
MKKINQYLVGGASLVIILAGLKLGAPLINPILLSFLLAICIIPLPEWLSKKGLSKGLSVTLSIVVVLIVGFLVTVLLANSIAALVNSFPEYQEKFTVFYNEFIEYAASYNLNVTELAQKINIEPQKIFEFATEIIGGLSSFFSSSFIIAMLIIFMLIELVDYRVDTRKGIREQGVRMEWLTNMSRDLRKYVTITALKGIITGAGNYLFLVILGVDFAFLWAFFSFLMNFIPNLGFIFSFIPPALIALITMGPWQAVIVFITFWAINFVVENVIGPVFMKEKLKISLLSTFLSLLVWGFILGMPGAILGVPLTMVVTRLYKDHTDREEEEQTPAE